MMTASFGRTSSLLREGAALMTSAPVRDSLADHLITPENAAFLFIDYQTAQLAAVRSMDHAPGQERRLDRQDHQDLRGPGRALDRQRRPPARGRPSPNSPACSKTTSRWTGQRSTPGKTSNSSGPSTRPAAASSSS